MRVALKYGPFRVRVKFFWKEHCTRWLYPTHYYFFKYRTIWPDFQEKT